MQQIKETVPKSDSRKIVAQALNFQNPDRLPIFDASIWHEFAVNWLKTRGYEETENIRKFFPNDLYTVRPNEVFWPSQMGLQKVQSDYDISNDGWGRTIKTRKDAKFSQVVDRLLKKPTDLDKLEFESSSLDIRYTHFMKMIDTHRANGAAVFANTGGPFIRSSFFRGETEFLMDMVTDESFAKELAAKVGEHLMNVGLEAMRRGRTEDFGIWIYDDMCNLQNPMFSPSSFEKILMPIYKKMISAYKKAGAKWVMLHCDGNLLPILDMLIEAGIDGINPVEYAAGLDVNELLPKYYGKLRFIGGVCNTHIMPTNDPDQITEHVKKIASAGKDGGLVIGTHSIGPEIKPESYEHYRSIIQTALE